MRLRRKSARERGERDLDAPRRREAARGSGSGSLRHVRADVARGSAPARASAGSDEKKVSSGRREAVAAAVLAAAALSQAAPALARGLPEFECTGEVTTGASGLQFCESVVGSGITPSKGSLIKAHYTGRLLDGRVFDSSYSRGSPLTFKVGVVLVIAMPSSSAGSTGMWLLKT